MLGQGVSLIFRHWVSHANQKISECHVFKLESGKEAQRHGWVTTKETRLTWDCCHCAFDGWMKIGLAAWLFEDSRVNGDAATCELERLLMLCEIILLSPPTTHSLPDLGWEEITKGIFIPQGKFCHNPPIVYPSRMDTRYPQEYTCCYVSCSSISVMWTNAQRGTWSSGKLDDPTDGPRASTHCGSH